MDFNIYRENVKSFLKSYYTDLKNVRLGSSEGTIKKLFENELSRVENYSQIVTKEILYAVEDQFEENYSSEKADLMGGEFKRKLTTISFSPMIKGELTEETPQINDRKEQYKKTAEVYKESSRKPDQQKHLCTASTLGAAFGFTNSLLIGPPGVLKTVFLTSGTALVFAGAVLVKILLLDEQESKEATKANDSSESNPTLISEKRNSLKNTEASPFAELLDARRKEVEKKILDGIDEAEGVFNQLMNEAQA